MTGATDDCAKMRFPEPLKSIDAENDYLEQRSPATLKMSKA